MKIDKENKILINEDFNFEFFFDKNNDEYNITL